MCKKNAVDLKKIFEEFFVQEPETPELKALYAEYDQLDMEMRGCVMDLMTKPPASAYKIENPYSPGLYCLGFKKKSKIRKLINNLFERRKKDE